MPTKVTIKGQVTLPKGVRDAAGIKAGDVVEVRAGADGTVVIEKQKADSDYLQRLGAISRRGLIRGITTDEMMRELRGDPGEDPILKP